MVLHSYYTTNTASSTPHYIHSRNAEYGENAICCQQVMGLW